MGDAEEFDEFYLATRRRLVLQTLALTGDLGAARTAVRDAFVSARQHWRTVSRLDDPEDWVRPHAWATAQRRHVARIWHREKGLDADQLAVLEGLHKLPDTQRKTLLLTHLAALPMPEIAREIGETRDKTERHLQTATSALAVSLDCASTSLRARLESLAPVANTAALPRAPIIRRSGLRRRRIHTLTGAALAVAVTVAAGAFVTAPVGTAPASAPDRPDAHPVTKAMLLPAAALTPLAPRRQSFTELSTGDNTSGTGINSLCQTARFADPQGTGTMVRKFAAAGRSPRNVVQTVEVSSTPGGATKAYRTTVGWFAGCSAARIQLLSAYRVSGLGDQAQALKLRIPGSRPRSYVVAVARSGALTVSTVVETRNARAADVNAVVDTLGTAVTRLCGADAAGSCADAPQVEPVLPPPSGETPGMLAVADLPTVGRITAPWVGTAPQRALLNSAATSCDRASFVQSGASPALSRTFLIPQAKLAQRFGLTETYGKFPSEKAARAFVAQIEKRMAGCEKKDPGATVSSASLQDKGYRGSQLGSWRVENQINRREDKIGYWMGVSRVGPYVAQVSFAPVKGADLDEDTFHSVLTRARDRLFELP